MSVNASLTGFDAHTVLSMRTCTCECRPETQMLLDEVLVPLHELDLARLADLSEELPIGRRCSSCGRNTIADYRIAAVVPAERSSPALVHVRRGSEQAYGLVSYGDSADTEVAAAILRSFPDPERRLQIPGDENALCATWGRPLSARAFVSDHFARFLASGKAARMIWLGDVTAYAFARREEADVPTADDIVDMLVSQWQVSPESLVVVSAEEGLDHTSSLADGLRDHSDLTLASITCIGNASAFERELRNALGAWDLSYETVGDDPSARVFRVALGDLSTELAVRDIARTALLFGRTPAEAAELEAQRSIVKLAGTTILKRTIAS